MPTITQGFFKKEQQMPIGKIIEGTTVHSPYALVRGEIWNNLYSSRKLTMRVLKH